MRISTLILILKKNLKLSRKNKPQFNSQKLSENKLIKRGSDDAT
jgi:hypothetical protein